MNNSRVLFAGTPAFALMQLQALCESGCIPVAVLTQPDRPAGRGKKLTASPVKKYSLEQNIAVLQPTTLRDEEVVKQLAALKPDLMIVAAYGLILPQAVLDIPKQGCLNVHASLLPRWRGAAPIQAAILAGDEQTGISLMSVTAGLDCGPVFATAAIDIGAHENAGALHDRLATLGGELLLRELAAILDGKLEAIAQDESRATYAGKITSADARLDWSRPADELARSVRAYNPVPGAWFMHDDERIKCWRATMTDDSGPPGKVVDVTKDSVVVSCGTSALAMQELQRPGKRVINATAVDSQLKLAGTTLS
ncbi:MAG: methionyl-tRNA formyltransferase [Gammaproteobacteria bacterium]|nr:methionyl-tRNA formyltransferase [Gammaproteobacteria bacterium]